MDKKFFSSIILLFFGYCIVAQPLVAQDSADTILNKYIAAIDSCDLIKFHLTILKYESASNPEPNDSITIKYEILNKDCILESNDFSIIKTNNQLVILNHLFKSIEVINNNKNNRLADIPIISDLKRMMKDQKTKQDMLAFASSHPSQKHNYPNYLIDSCDSKVELSLFPDNGYVSRIDYIISTEKKFPIRCTIYSTSNIQNIYGEKVVYNFNRYNKTHIEKEAKISFSKYFTILKNGAIRPNSTYSSYKIEVQ